MVPNRNNILNKKRAVALGIGGVLLVTAVYISEIWQAESRPVMQGILAIFFPVGIVASGGLNILFSQWRQAFWLGIIPIVIALLIGLLLPETTAWKSIEKDKTPEKSLFDPAYRANLLRGTLIFGSVLIGLWGLFSWIPTWIHYRFDCEIGLTHGQKIGNYAVNRGKADGSGL